MIKTRLSTIVFLLAYFFTTAFSENYTQIQNTINHIIAKAPSSLNAGVMVEDLTDGKLIYANNTNRYYIPASNLKLFTAYAALKELGVNFTFDTSISINKAELSQGILNGNVYLQFSGDPSFTEAQLNELIAILATSGIKKINGRFIIVNNSFDDVGYGPGWMWDDKNYCYDEPVNGMSVEHNCFTINLEPSKQIAQTSTLQIFKNAIPFKVKDQVYTTAADVICPLIINSNGNNDYSLAGCVNVGTENDPANITPIAINNVNKYITQLIQDDLKRNNIKLLKPIQFGTANNQAKPLLIIKSKPLSDIIKEMLKKSDDFYAGVLFKKIGQAYFGGQGTWEKGQKALQAIMQTNLGINQNDWVIVDGSGISRYNMLTPQQIMSLLNYIYKTPAISRFFIPALPVSGTDGTISNRMTSSAVRGRVFAKTGSMTGVLSLSGYIKTSRNHTLAFVILMNNFMGKEQYYEGLQDEICAYLASKL